MKPCKQNPIFLAMLAALSLSVLQACSHSPTTTAQVSEPALPDSISRQFEALSQAQSASGSKDRFLLVRVPSTNNAISNGLMTLWGREGSRASEQINDLLTKGVSQIGVTGDSSRVNLAVVRAALKAAAPAKNPTNLYVFVGDYQPSERLQPPAGIQVHLVREDGSILP